MSKIKNYEVKRCPFCQSELLELHTSVDYFTQINCKSCGANGPYVHRDSFDNPSGRAIDAWNKRFVFLGDTIIEQEPPKQKPPLGIIPKEVWMKQRMIELLGAIQRYVDEDFETGSIDMWIDEFNRLRNTIKSIKGSEQEKTSPYSSYSVKDNP
jgi:hypothetical protein